MASDRWASPIASSPCRSAIVLASLRIRLHALADIPAFATAFSRNSRHGTDSLQNSLICRPLISELVRIPSVEKRFSCMFLALLTLSATAELGSACSFLTMLLASTGLSHKWMSILSISGPESLDRYAARRAGEQLHLSPSP